MNNLDNKIALVTGAGRGIGKAIAIALARAGCRVILCLSNSGTARRNAAIQSTRVMGKRCWSFQQILPGMKISSASSISSLKAWGGVDILVNNAGWGKRAPVVRAHIEDWDQTFRLNLRAPMILAKSFLPGMIEKGNGAVINIGSVSGKTGEADGAAYAASKFGLIGFTQSLYEEVREYGIKVSVILPGFVDTPMIPPVKHLDRSKMIRSEDVADAVMFVVNSSPTCCPVELTVRPQRTPNR